MPEEETQHSLAEGCGAGYRHHGPITIYRLRRMYCMCCLC